jgi:hypothetical protein
MIITTNNIINADLLQQWLPVHTTRIIGYSEQGSWVPRMRSSCPLRIVTVVAFRLQGRLTAHCMEKLVVQAAVGYIVPAMKNDQREDRACYHSYHASTGKATRQLIVREKAWFS